MISVADNAAANMLINLVGRPAVEAALTTTRWRPNPEPVPDHP